MGDRILIFRILYVIARSEEDSCFQMLLFTLFFKVIPLAVCHNWSFGKIVMIFISMSFIRKVLATFCKCVISKHFRFIKKGERWNVCIRFYPKLFLWGEKLYKNFKALRNRIFRLTQSNWSFHKNLLHRVTKAKARHYNMFWSPSMLEGIVQQQRFHTKMNVIWKIHLNYKWGTEAGAKAGALIRV